MSPRLWSSADSMRDKRPVPMVLGLSVSSMAMNSFISTSLSGAVRTALGFATAQVQPPGLGRVGRFSGGLQSPHHQGQQQAVYQIWPFARIGQLTGAERRAPHTLGQGDFAYLSGEKGHEAQAGEHQK
eukprot:TRINITY_DN9665_c0_g2_i1.p2 TRINITY_DN9665_c0_g2~~TRINITY_DN9665_c0_g2_i1.p2  ORF type:complete len:128 (-),score=23.30 TRINITY_DN9665_c0_g2_i1:8-391(-)